MQTEIHVGLLLVLIICSGTDIDCPPGKDGPPDKACTEFDAGCKTNPKCNACKSTSFGFETDEELKAKRRNEEDRIWLAVGINTVPRKNNAAYLLHTLQSFSDQLSSDPIDPVSNYSVGVHTVNYAPGQHTVFKHAKKRFGDRFTFIERNHTDCDPAKDGDFKVYHT